MVFCLSANIEASTVALAVINFERLCIKSIVTKANRKLTMAVSLLLAFKFNETAVTTQYQKTLRLLFAFFDQEWDLAKKQIFDAEFGAYVHLGFSLHIPYMHVFTVYCRLLKLVHNNSRHYLGDDMQEAYLQDLYTVERWSALEREQAEAEAEAEAEAAAKEEEERQQQQQESQAKVDEEAKGKSSLRVVKTKLAEHLKSLPGRLVGSISSTSKVAESSASGIPMMRPSFHLGQSTSPLSAPTEVAEAKKGPSSAEDSST
jgi:hypothetical protein